MLTVTRSGPTVADVERMVLDAIKLATEDTIDHWHSTYLDRHFTEDGFAHYKYQLRKGQDESYLVYSNKTGRLVRNRKYYWQKYSQKHTHDPLVFSGQARQQAKQSIRLSSRFANGRSIVRAQGVMNLPRYFYTYNPAVGAPDKVDELTRTAPDEEREMMDFYDRAVGRHISSASLRSTVNRVA